MRHSQLHRRSQPSPRLLTACLILLAFTAIALASPAFDDMERRSAPQIARQACSLARWAVERRIAGTGPAKPPIKLDRVFSRRGGVFVTLTKAGNPRGCMGSVDPMRGSLSAEITANAVAAATADPRRKPLAPGELSDVRFHVAIVGPLRAVRDRSELRPKTLGLLVRNGSRMGILLPGEARTASWQLAECKRKAGLKQTARVHMYVFRTITFDEQIPAQAGR